MRPLLPLTLLLAASLFPPAYAKRPGTPTVPTVPSIQEVVAAEGFVPTPSQSEIYRPGAVLVPNGRGGHDVVVEDCIDTEPSVSIMSQSSIATTLAGGVSARLGAARGTASAGVEKRLSFVDPEQRTIPLARLQPTKACISGVQTASAYQDLSDAIVLHDVLVAIIKNTVCTKADASGSMVALGAAEATAFSECVQESDGQVPLGYKAVPLAKALALAGATPAASTTPTRPPVVPGTPAAASASVDFGKPSGLGIDAQLKEQECDRQAQENGAAARAARLTVAEQDVKAKARAAWRSLESDLEKCTRLQRAQRNQCVAAARGWLAQARSMPVSIPAGVESSKTDCGPRQTAFEAESRTVVADEVGTAEALLMRLEAPDGAPPAAAATSAIEWVRIAGGSFEMGSNDGEKHERPVHTVHISSFELTKTEVTVGQYRACVDAGVCSEPREGEICNWWKSDRENHPINCVAWTQAQTFASWAGGRLPTEAEWEYAARSGGKPWNYPWGNEPASCNRANMEERGTGKGCGQNATWPVCTKPEGNSTHGVCDLAGNVWEWVQDSYKDTYKRAPDDGTAFEDEKELRRVLRGGSIHNAAPVLGASHRAAQHQRAPGDLMGFRLAR